MHMVRRLCRAGRPYLLIGVIALEFLRRHLQICLFVALAVLLGACSPGETAGDTSTKPPEAPAKKIPVRREGETLVAGPLSSASRGVDWFWCPDGRRLIVTVKTGDAMQVWVLDPSSGGSSLLREGGGIDVTFPIGWAGPDQLLALDYPAGAGKYTLFMMDFSGAKPSFRELHQFDGRVVRHAAGPDGAFASFQVNSAKGGSLVRVDTGSGKASTLIESLRASDVAHPVWFAPDGRTVVLTDPQTRAGKRLLVIDIESGKAVRHETGAAMVDRVYWSPDSSRFVYKVASGDYKTTFVSDFEYVLSQRLRVVDTQGKTVKDLSLPKGQYAGDVAWTGPDSLVTRESPDEKASGWVIDLQGTSRRATEADLQHLALRATPYPMPKGTGAFAVTIRSVQQQGGAPAEELLIAKK